MEKPKQDKLGQILLQNKIISEEQLGEGFAVLDKALEITDAAVQP